MAKLSFVDNISKNITMFENIYLFYVAMDQFCYVFGNSKKLNFLDKVILKSIEINKNMQYLDKKILSLNPFRYVPS